MNCAEKRQESRVEYEMAEELIRSLGQPLSTEGVSEDNDNIRFRLRGESGWKLASLVFSRSGLRRLAADPNRQIKIEYLSRDIARVARVRREYHYPRLIDHLQ